MLTRVFHQLQDLKKYFDSCNGDLDPETVKVRDKTSWRVTTANHLIKIYIHMFLFLESCIWPLASCLLSNLELTTQTSSCLYLVFLYSHSCTSCWKALLSVIVETFFIEIWSHRISSSTEWVLICILYKGRWSILLIGPVKLLCVLIIWKELVTCVRL